MEVHPSATKHGVSPEDAVHAATAFVWSMDIDGNDPGRELRLGFSTSGALLEVILLRLEDSRVLVIHAMRARRNYVVRMRKGVR